MIGARPAFLLAALAAGAGLPGDLPAASGPVEVRIEGIRDTAGWLRISLFASEDGFPEAYGKAARTLSLPVDGATAAARFDSVPAGDWALAVLHDADGDGRLDRNALGVPREGIGASNGATRRLGAPRFREARFHFHGGSLQLRILLMYW